jgi:hypothetical protein
MFFENYTTRLTIWQAFRQTLESSDTPFDDVLLFWNKAPLLSKSCDPYDESTWLTAWELIESNDYCEFSKILAIYYTLSLTDRFANCYYDIQIVNNLDEKMIHYLLIVDDNVFGYKFDQVVKRSELPANLIVTASYKKVRI